ncbi:hypothetical protein ACOME3_007315 [Neoechinorhynchus agilis]
MTSFKYTPEYLIHLADPCAAIPAHTFLIIIAIATALVSTIGLLGSYRRSQTILRTFAIAIIISMVVDTSLAIASYNFDIGKIGKRFMIGVEQTFHKAINIEDRKRLRIVNVIQSEFQCCGFHGPTDWPRSKIPATCILTSKGGGFVSKHGCKTAVFEAAKNMACLIGNGLIALIICEFLVLWAVFRVARNGNAPSPMQRFGLRKVE